MDWLSKTSLELFKHIPETILSYYVAQKLKLNINTNYLELSNTTTFPLIMDNNTAHNKEYNAHNKEYNAFNESQLINQLLVQFVLNKNQIPYFVTNEQELIKWLLIVFVIN